MSGVWGQGIEMKRRKKSRQEEGTEAETGRDGGDVTVGRSATCRILYTSRGQQLDTDSDIRHRLLLRRPHIRMRPPHPGVLATRGLPGISRSLHRLSLVSTVSLTCARVLPMERTLMSLPSLLRPLSLTASPSSPSPAVPPPADGADSSSSSGCLTHRLEGQKGEERVRGEKGTERGDGSEGEVGGEESGGEGD